MKNTVFQNQNAKCIPVLRGLGFCPSALLLEEAEPQLSSDPPPTVRIFILQITRGLNIYRATLSTATP